MQEEKKHTPILFKIFTFKCTNSDKKNICNDCIKLKLNKPYLHKKKHLTEKQDFKEQNLYFNHRISFDTKGSSSPSSERNSYIMVVVDAFTHVTLNPVPHCNPYYNYTSLYEHWIAKFGLPEILVTDNGAEFINKEIDKLFE